MKNNLIITLTNGHNEMEGCKITIIDTAENVLELLFVLHFSGEPFKHLRHRSLISLGVLGF